ncbi:MAG: serine protease [Gammaproteobacteria bacterium]|jgi:secreted trypsin-like serine protease|nr:serine protease [Gammaproteobacteria bacterium]MBT5223311.1 serine protease [Gammaproteobacteria bacterium]MBT5827023.1 serine protease [Gammaproteobacteria bacterium]MBT5967150.1 serine protease [Gammaproteobacteria bacterium]MBT6420029.1 serine protease [Gammaproteobacteria bacterium]
MTKKMFISLLCLLIISASSAFASERMARIIGGKQASSTAWPSMAGLADKHSIVFCGASLIGKDWVLTAAHCVYEMDISDFDVFINQPNLERQSANSEFIPVESVLLHPNYNNETLENDLALIKLATSSRKPPIHVLAPFTAQDNAGKLAIALGWGSTTTEQSAPYPVNLQQVDLPLIDNRQCEAAMGPLTEDMLCAGDGLGERDTCFGDSGGPLTVFDTESKTWRQAGITSWGFDCAVLGTYGVYTRLKNYAQFISTNICSAAETPAPVSLNLEVNGNRVTASWNALDNASGYRLNYAPYPRPDTIYSFDMNQATVKSMLLPRGSAFYVGITSYNGNCLSKYSNIEHFVIQ